ncbi:hypothetical protein [Aureimonas endophytica]|uniref:hypothetical protein n=1 Tax=Aureimonas endophytica TaxID=2027858 RepID=UPI001662D5D4|nr:hypothetical protein [Aureimonas endophytica]
MSIPQHAQLRKPTDDSLEAIEAALAALDDEPVCAPPPTTWVRQEHHERDEWHEWLIEEFGIDPGELSRNFVNSKTPKQRCWNEFVRLLRQGFPADEASREARRLAELPLVRGTTSHSRSSSSITLRAISSMKRRRVVHRRRPAGRHRFDEHDAAGWHNALAAIPGCEVWTFDILLAKDLQRRAYAQTDRGTAHWLKRRLDRQLRKALGYVPEMIFAIGIESRSGLNLHVHIVAAIQPQHRPAVLEALRAFAEVPAARKPWIDHKRARTAGKAVYAIENARETEAMGFVPGRTVIVSQNVKSAATAACSSAVTKRPTSRPAVRPTDESAVSINIDLSSLESVAYDCDQYAIDAGVDLNHEAPVTVSSRNKPDAAKYLYLGLAVCEPAGRARSSGNDSNQLARADRSRRARDGPRRRRHMPGVNPPRSRARAPPPGEAEPIPTHDGISQVLGALPGVDRTDNPRIEQREAAEAAHPRPRTLPEALFAPSQ